MRDVSVCWMGCKEFLLAVQCCRHWLLCIDILLTPVHNTDESKFERVGSSGQDIVSIGSGVHEVELGEDSDGPTTLRFTVRASFSDSEFARSTFAAETERITLHAGKTRVMTALHRKRTSEGHGPIWFRDVIYN